MEEEELSLPRAAMNKLIKEVLPEIRVANDSREVILNLGKEFIRLITKQANEICEENQKRTMSGEHVLHALKKMGLNDYICEGERVLNTCKGKKRRQSTKLEHLGIPEEELLRQQQELFARARAEQAIMEQELLHNSQFQQQLLVAQSQSQFNLQSTQPQPQQQDEQIFNQPDQSQQQQQAPSSIPPIKES
ncbi:protein Dr1-like [Panonychus citri]|uniref:protein Dr1-like n=1 Tax=Panonychus citri TaxID=50023 RepID=UPI002307F53B|nr:protein Dr1-like [Panonychus citri]